MNDHVDLELFGHCLPAPSRSHCALVRYQFRAFVFRAFVAYLPFPERLGLQQRRLAVVLLDEEHVVGDLRPPRRRDQKLDRAPAADGGRREAALLDPPRSWVWRKALALWHVGVRRQALRDSISQEAVFGPPKERHDCSRLVRGSRYPWIRDGSGQERPGSAPEPEPYQEGSQDQGERINRTPRRQGEEAGPNPLCTESGHSRKGDDYQNRPRGG